MRTWTEKDQADQVKPHQEGLENQCDERNNKTFEVANVKPQYVLTLSLRQPA